jgi:hypothetical protein
MTALSLKEQFSRSSEAWKEQSDPIFRFWAEGPASMMLSMVLDYRIVDQANIFICLYELEVCYILQVNT